MDGPTLAAVVSGDRFHLYGKPLGPLEQRNSPDPYRSPSGQPEERAEDQTKPNKGSAFKEIPDGTTTVKTRASLEIMDMAGQDARDDLEDNSAHAPRGDDASTISVQTASVLSNGKTVWGPPVLDEQVEDADRTGSPPQGTGPKDMRLQQERVLRLPAEKLQALTSSPESIPSHPLEQRQSPRSASEGTDATVVDLPPAKVVDFSDEDVFTSGFPVDATESDRPGDAETKRPRKKLTIEVTAEHNIRSLKSPGLRPGGLQRALSTPSSIKSPQSPSRPDRVRPTLKVPDGALRTEHASGRGVPSSGRPFPSPMPPSIPLPPMSIPTYLQLELSSTRPSQLYLHQSSRSDFPYESSQAKLERLVNFLLLPLHLESVLWFGMLTCLDSWLHTFTILPLRLLKSFYLLTKSWAINLMTEGHFVSNFVYNGAGRMWERWRRSSMLQDPGPPASQSSPPETKLSQDGLSRDRKQAKYHQRTKSIPSTLLPDNKADILKGLLIICTCLILLKLDASRMYHWIRGQAAIKLYVIYNLLEVCDRLLSALGQDVLECLFSREALERKPDGHSKVLRPFWLFVLALVYTVAHSTALFYQVITLNVAVNSYSNALITLLLSNQFVEIKSTVFKKFEKENLFQLTCADIVERFQLWHMLIIIASRNIVETGGLSAGLNALTGSSLATASTALTSNNNVPLTTALPPMSSSTILPRSFTLMPTVVSSITSYAPAVSQVLGPFLAVLGSEMLVDWIKHAYINKFNNTRPTIYDRFLDVLAKDYYTHAFGDQNLTKRLGLPVIPLSCLLIRASVQTYQMYMAAWVPARLSSSSNSLASIYEHYSTARSTMPLTTGTAISRTVDDLIRAIPAFITGSPLVTHLTAVLVVLLIFLMLLACKLVLGMMLLAFARSRYHSMKMREGNSTYRVEGGRRVGGWGVVEVDEDKRRWIYEDDPGGLRALREREEREKQKQQKDKDRGGGVDSLDTVERYEMVAKRIW
ncbi:hypothetical protein A1O1_00612 [Capronia coronata CBS 617.96]|uniref:Cytomegalovirus gH-receptor family protein n=1 Tax=Capronia coronata CBS 617.96 TaxID=1182541 RepID=W9Z0N2_9EURO|nr:uncharacterized protein A1O1_00612 [Capronia coronata CBS 617.96]EXJ95490.1 hypothetical protein A1O1_00612 [Capronia coronata CBS 617.96]